MNFYKGKRVLVTGHTGFKGSWLLKVLELQGAKCCGYSLKPPTDPALFQICHPSDDLISVEGDVRDLDHLMQVFDEFQPEIVIHMAAQPLVRESYRKPVYTYHVNVMGTVNVMECVRTHSCVRSVVNVTTDKVYENLNLGRDFKEEDRLDGCDPYSNSKSCSELVTAAYRRSFFDEMGIPVSTVRAGNVIGGGDFALDRIVPDCYRAAAAGETVILRNPTYVRPFQHVLEPVVTYLLLAHRQYEDPALAGSYNVGPDLSGCCSVEKIVSMFSKSWQSVTGRPFASRVQGDGGPREASLLMLDCSKVAEVLHKKPVWTTEEAVARTAAWYGAYAMGEDAERCMLDQIRSYLSLQEI